MVLLVVWTNGGSTARVAGRSCRIHADACLPEFAIVAQWPFLVKAHWTNPTVLPSEIRNGRMKIMACGDLKATSYATSAEIRVALLGMIRAIVGAGKFYI